MQSDEFVDKLAATVLPGDEASLEASRRRRAAAPLRSWHVKVHRDIPYPPPPGAPAHATRHLLDVYEPTGEIVDGRPPPFSISSGKPRPTVFFLHGGGWKSGAKDWGLLKQAGSSLASRGFTVVMPNYRLAPLAVHEAFINSGVQSAVYSVLVSLALALARWSGLLPPALDPPLGLFSFLLLTNVALFAALSVWHVARRGSEGSVRVEGMLEDAAAALAWTIRSGGARVPGIDARNIFLMGQSAGAHLSAMLVARAKEVLIDAPGVALPPDVFGRHIQGACFISPPLSGRNTAHGDGTEFLSTRRSAKGGAPLSIWQRIYSRARHYHAMDDAFGPDEKMWASYFPVEMLEAEEAAAAATTAASAVALPAPIPVPLLFLYVGTDWGLEESCDEFLPLLGRRRRVLRSQVTRLHVTNADHISSILGWGKGPDLPLPPGAPGDAWQETFGGAKGAGCCSLFRPPLWTGNEVVLPAVLAWLAKSSAARRRTPPGSHEEPDAETALSGGTLADDWMARLEAGAARAGLDDTQGKKV